jgi:hypothetical protein
MHGQLERGAIRNRRGYEQAKFLYHGGWGALLIANITPSDIDAVLDKDGRILFIEFSSSIREWKKLDRGQRLLYANCIRQRELPCCSVLGKHSVKDRDIDTVADIESFQIMIWDCGPMVSPVISGDWWQQFVTRWVNFDDDAWRANPEIGQMRWESIP